MLRFLIVIPAFFLLSTFLFSQKTGNVTLLEHKGKKILNFQSTNNSMDGMYPRSNYIHPLYGLDGEILTEDFPADHPHHRGIFWTWSQLWDGDKRLGDGWLIKDISWEVTSVNKIHKAGKPGLKTACLWYSVHSGNTPFMQDETKIFLVAESPELRRIDIEITITSLIEDLYIGGSEDLKGYGGFSPRFVLPVNTVFEGRNGRVNPENTAVLAEDWVNITGKFSDFGKTRGIVMMSHPSNPVKEDRWILRSSGSMQNHVFPGNTKHPVPIKKSLKLKYSLLIHTGISTAEIHEHFQSFANNP